jgi:hypothetical protein
MSAINRPTEVLGGDISFFTATTLVDISDTGYNNPKGMLKEYKQAQNLNTLIQILSLRTQLVLSGVHILYDQNLSKYNFGSAYTGNHTVWTFKFASERPDIWNKDNDPLYYAMRDCDNVPIHSGLDETIITSPYFNTLSNSLRNIYFINSENL